MITSHDRPRLREDLVAEAIEDRGARFIDVIDPDNGNSYRFYDVEYSLACAMDGQRDIPGLVRWAEEELGIAPTRGELETVISTLGDLGYLDRVDQPAMAPEAAVAAVPADLGLAPGVRAPSPAAPASGIEVELGHFEQPAAPAAKVEPVPELELGSSGGGAHLIELEDDVPDVTLGPSGGAAPVLPVPGARPGSQPAISARSKSETLRGEGRLSEPAITAQPRRPSEKQVRPSAPVAAAPAARRSEPKLPGPASDPSLNLSLPIRPDDVKEAVRQSREMRSVDVPPELMQALEAAEQPASASLPPRSRPATSPPLAASALPPPSPARPAAVASTALPSAAVLDPIAPLSGAPLSVSEPISPPSVPPLVPAPRAESRSEGRGEAKVEPRPEPRVEARPEPRAKSEPRLEYPRSPEPRPLAPAPREPAPSVPPPLELSPPRRSSVWIVAVLVLAILGVVGFGVWKFVLNKPAATDAPPPVKAGGTGAEPAAVQPTPPAETPPSPPPLPSAKLSLVNPPPTSVKMPASGVLQSIVADGTVVKESDEVARLGGAKPFEQQINAAKGDLEKRYPSDVARLKAKLAAQPNDRGAKAELARREARIAQRTKELEQAQAELAKHVLTAKSAGKVTVVAKAGARLAAEAEVATIELEPYLSGAMDLGKPVTSQPGDTIEVRLKAGEATLQCTLETVQDSKVAFRCPVAAGFADGVEVVVEPK